jgi:uncharacterized protein YraI
MKRYLSIALCIILSALVLTSCTKGTTGKTTTAAATAAVTTTEKSTELYAQSYVVSTGADFLNIRTGPATTYRDIGNVPSGAQLFVFQELNGWGYTEYMGKGGWVFLNFLKPSSEIYSPVKPKNYIPKCIGLYKSYAANTEQKYTPSIEFLKNGTFTFTVNLLEGMGTAKGTYVLKNNIATLTVTKRSFSGFTGDAVKKCEFKIINNNLLQYLGEDIGITTNLDLFTKVL